MDIFEFELRYKSYIWLSNKFDLNLSDDIFLDLVKITNKWSLVKNLTQTSPDELKELTIETYTDYKKNFLTNFGNKELESWNLKLYIDRLEYELKVIKEMWFNTYMLVVADYVNQARKMWIVVGPGRWSGAGSLLAWCIGITDINPLLYDLLFERFLNPARVSMPDFDIDFDDENRDKIIQYVNQKYGKNNVCAIWTFMQLSAKSSFKDVARVFGVPFDRSNYISNILPSDKPILQAIQSEDESYSEIRSIYNSDDILKKVIDLSVRLEWNIRQLWVHACGVIIAPSDVTDYTATQQIKGQDDTVSQYDGHILEKIWLLKMDFLGLRNLSVIRNCIKVILKRVESDGLSINQSDKKIFQNFIQTMQFYPPMWDIKTFVDVFQKWDTTGIFQFEWAWIRRFLVDLKATDINDLFAMNALFRPWPIEFIPIYIRRKHWLEKVDYLLPEIISEIQSKYWKDSEKILEDEKIKLTEDLGPIMDITYWIAVYQEQLMFLVQKMAGFSLPEADMLRRWIGKKIKEIIEKLKIEFVDKSISFRGYKPETARIIYEKMIEPAASYSFNKSHSVCYSYIAYQTAYLKAHYPLEFYTALMRSVEEDTDKLSFFVQEAQVHGFEVLNPNINESFNHIAAIGKNIRLWFLSVKWLGTMIWEYIQKERKQNWKFKNFEDFLKRCKSIVNKKSIESLVKCSALEWFCDQMTVLENIQQVLERTESSSENSDGWLFGDMVDDKIIYKKNYQTNIVDKLRLNFEIYKWFVGIHPFDWLYPYLKKYNFISQFKNNEQFWDFTIFVYIKNIQRAKKKWFYILVEDLTENIEFFLKDKMDLSVMDILIIKWSKRWRFITLYEIIRTDIEDLINKAKNSQKYDNHRTSTRVKQERNREDNIWQYFDQKEKNIELNSEIEENIE